MWHGVLRGTPRSPARGVPESPRPETGQLYGLGTSAGLAPKW